MRNVAFEATEKELRQLFSPFGQVIIMIFISEFQVFLGGSENCLELLFHHFYTSKNVKIKRQIKEPSLEGQFRTQSVQFSGE